ncbi:Hypothetical Protein XCAW_01176 [Xanthomonas citri subsp. citri Aw12879]|nr:Hypothetical Protein XCAW_01176 [Xanthomonas citri subsp. citri Aw12879]
MKEKPAGSGGANVLPTLCYSRIEPPCIGWGNWVTEA